MSWNKIYSDSGFYMDSESGKIGYKNGTDEVIEFVAPTATELVTKEETITETINNMHDVYYLLGKLMDNTIQLINIEVEDISFNVQPSITVKYRKTQPCNLGLMQNTGYVDICSHDDTLDYLKREMKKQFTEELERAKIKEEPKKETVLQFKEISW